MNRTKIEWTDFSWNPLIGCSKVSEGCEHCYALRMASRFPDHYDWETDDGEAAGSCLEFDKSGNACDWSGTIATCKSRLDQPLRRRKPSRIFVCSMSDLFHEKVPDDFRDQVFAVMALCPQHTFLVLTKRIEQARNLLCYEHTPFRVARFAFEIAKSRGFDAGSFLPDVFYRYGYARLSPTWPRPNVYLGVTCENQARADERIPILLQTPAALHFISCEPMLTPVSLSSFILHPSSLSWVICGGETGPHARPFHLDWARSLRDQCQTANIPFFMKQGGKIKYESLPTDLQIRQFPQ